MVGDLKLPVPDLPGSITDGHDVIVGLRPEDIVAADARDRSHFIDIDFVEELGATRLLHGRFARQAVVVQVPTAQAFADETKVGFSIAPAAVHVFDAKSGERLNQSGA
jgi:sn-glycerol 3-phosphate transport system ATP-binding protein